MSESCPHLMTQVVVLKDGVSAPIHHCVPGDWQGPCDNCMPGSANRREMDRLAVLVKERLTKRFCP